MVNYNYPDNALDAYDADGAFEIGGGDYKFGQDYNETVIRKMFSPTVPTPTNALNLLAQQLHKMPLEALQFFKDLIPDAIEGAFDTVAGAVNAILGALRNTVTFLTHNAFTDWVGTQFSNLDKAFRQVMDVLGGLIVTPINAAVQAVKDWWNRLTGKTSRLKDNGKMTVIDVDGVEDEDASLGDSIGKLVDNLAKAAGNVSGTNFKISDVFNLFADQQKQITQLNEGLAALQSDQTAQTNSGNSFTFKFGDLPDGPVPADFTKVLDQGTGGFQIYNGALEWFDSGSSSSDERFVYVKGKLLTDYFETSFVMPRRPEGEEFGIAPPLTYLMGRSNLTGSRYCWAAIGYERSRMGCTVDGVDTIFPGAESTSVKAPAGAYITFRGGTTGGVRVFQLLINNQVRMTTTDTANLSYVGEDYRYCGLGGHGTVRFNGQGTPGSISVWTMNDNVPTATRGTGFRIYRAATAAVTAVNSHNAFVPFGANTLDTIDRVTQGFAWDAATQTITVQEAGWYNLGIGAQFESVVRAGTLAELGFLTQNSMGTRTYKAWRHTADDFVLTNGQYYAEPQNTSGVGSVQVYLEAGEKVQPAVRVAKNRGASAANPIVGSGDGSATFISAVLVSK